MATIDAFDDRRDDRETKINPAALILFNPVIDNGPNGFGYDHVEPYWQAFSPLHNIKGEHPPTIFHLGTKDHLIPASTAMEYKNAIEKTGTLMELQLYEGQPHAFFNRNVSHDSFVETLLSTHAFLYEIGFINTSPIEGRELGYQGVE